ncbi:MAG: hypothetical protein J0H11_06885 [Rhizobiales bacterium]|nr:hypothetical protein [Hyphomicrobiales bacterium]
MIFSAIAAVAIGWLLRSYWLAFIMALAVSFASVMLNGLIYSDRPDLNDFQFRTVLAGFLAGALGIVVAFLRTAFDEYRAETRVARANRQAGAKVSDKDRPRMSLTLLRRLRHVDAQMKRLGGDMNNLTFNLVDRWVNRASYRDAGRE